MPKRNQKNIQKVGECKAREMLKLLYDETFYFSDSEKPDILRLCKNSNVIVEGIEVVTCGFLDKARHVKLSRNIKEFDDALSEFSKESVDNALLRFGDNALWNKILQAVCDKILKWASNTYTVCPKQSICVVVTDELFNKSDTLMMLMFKSYEQVLQDLTSWLIPVLQHITFIENVYIVVTSAERNVKNSIRDEIYVFDRTGLLKDKCGCTAYRQLST